MANDNEPAKLLLPYLQRADELQKHDPLVAYYCRLYAMERGLKFPQSERTKTTNSLLVSLMKQLEKDKKSLKLGPDDQLHLEGFALNVFEKADKQDRAGRANLSTAKTFYAASIFFEILNQFGELQPDLEQKQKYAAWKAADIRKAIKEGRAPVPGPPGGEENFSIPSSTSSGAYDVEPSRPDPASKSAPPQFYDELNRTTSDISPSHSYDEVKRQHLSDIPHSHSYNEVNRHHTSDMPPSHSYDEVNRQHTSDIPPPPSNNSPTAPPPFYPSSNYPSNDIHPSQNIKPEDASYPQPYHHQPYPQEPHHQFPQDYPSHEAPSHSLPNFQSYPSFTETSLPTAPSHYPSYFQGSDSAYPNPDSAEYTPAPSQSNQHITAPSPTTLNQHIYAQGKLSSRNENTYDNIPAPVQTYHYDSNYQPAPEKIAEAHKAARFAVGALAFDDVATAVDFLKKSLELLTNPAAGH